MDFEYKVKISGDTSNLEKALKLADGQMQKLEKDEVLIKLAYDGNYDSFYKTLKQIYKEAPEIGVKFQYDLNLKALEQEKKKLDKMELFSDPEKLYGHFVERFDEFRKSAKGLSNTDIINSESLKDARIELSEILNVLGSISPDAYDLINKPVRNLIESFKEFDNIDPEFDIVNPKDLENQRKIVLEIEENIKSLQSNLKDFHSDQVVKMVLDTSEFDEKFTDIKNKLDQLDSEKTIKINAEYSESKSSGSDKLSDIAKGWSSAVDLSGKHSKERYTVANSQTGYVANSYLEAEAESVEAKLISKLINDVKQKYDQIVDTVVHSHPKDVAAFSDDDISLAFKQVEQGIINQVVISAKEVMSIDYSKVNTDMSYDIVNKIIEEYELVDYELYNKAKVLIDRDAKEIFSNIAKAALPDKGTGKKIYEDFISGFDEMYSSVDSLSYSLEDVNNVVYDYFNEVLEKYVKSSIVSGATLQGYSENFGKGIDDYVNSVVGEDIQRRYQEVLKSIFSNSKYLKSGETSAISVSSVEDFKFANDKQSDKEVEVSVKPKVDINTFIGQIREELDYSDSEVGISVYPKNIASFVDEIKESVKDSVVEINVKPTVTENFNNDKTKLSSSSFDSELEKLQKLQNEYEKLAQANEDFENAETSKEENAAQRRIDSIGKTIESLSEKYSNVLVQMKDGTSKILDVQDLVNFGDFESEFNDLKLKKQEIADIKIIGQEQFDKEIEPINQLFDHMSFYSGKTNDQLTGFFSSYGDDANDEFKNGVEEIRGLITSIDNNDHLQIFDASFEEDGATAVNLLQQAKEWLDKVDNGIIKLHSDESYGSSGDKTDDEVQKFDKLKTKIEQDVVNAVETKTSKFENERDRVDQALQDEINKLDLLKEKIVEISDKNSVNINVKETIVDDSSNNLPTTSSKKKKKTNNANNVEVSSEFIPPTSAIKQKGLVGDSAGWSWLEDIGGGQLQRTVVSLNQNTGKFESTVKDIDTDFKKVENEVLKLDKEIESLYQKETSYNDIRASRLEEERNVLLEILDLYAKSERYAYSDADNANFQNRRQYDFEGMALKSNAKAQAEAEKYEQWKQKQLQIGAEQQAENQRKSNAKAQAEAEKQHQAWLQKQADTYNAGSEYASEQERAIKVNSAIERQVTLHENILQIRKEISKLDSDSDQAKIDELKQEENILQKVRDDAERIVNVFGNKSEISDRDKRISSLNLSSDYKIANADDIKKAENDYSILIANMKSAGEYASTLVTETEEWKTSLGNIATQSDLDSLVSKLKNVSSEFAKLKAEQKNIPQIVEPKNISQNARNVINAYKTLATNEMRIAQIEKDRVSDLTPEQKVRLEFYKKQNDELKKTINSVSVYTEREINEINKASEAYENAQKNRDIYYKTSAGVTIASLQDMSGFDEQLIQLQNLEDQTDEYREKINKLSESLKRYDLLQQSLSYNKSEENIQKVKKAAKELQEAFNELNGKGVNKNSRSNVILKTTQWMMKNTKITIESRNALKGYIAELKTVDDGGRFNEIIRKINDIKQSEIQAGNATLSFSDKLKLSYQNMLRYFASFGSFYQIINIIKQMSATVIELDTNLTELRKVSNATDEELSQAFKKSTETAKELGSTISDVISITSDWARLGYSVDEAEELARVTTLFKTVGDNMDADSASEYLVSTLQGYQLSANEALSIVDKYNEVANNFAIDTAGIGEGLKRSAAAFNAANTDLSESIALITATNAVVQDPDSVGKLYADLYRNVY